MRAEICTFRSHDQCFVVTVNPPRLRQAIAACCLAGARRRRYENAAVVPLDQTSVEGKSASFPNARVERKERKTHFEDFPVPGFLIPNGADRSGGLGVLPEPDPHSEAERPPTVVARHARAGYWYTDRFFSEGRVAPRVQHSVSIVGAPGPEFHDRGESLNESGSIVGRNQAPTRPVSDVYAVFHVGVR